MNLVKAAYYGYTATAGAGNGGASSQTREFFQIGQKLRFRQYGTLRQIKIYTSTVTNTTEFYITIWRGTPGSWTRVGTSENIRSQLANTTINTVTFTSPIEGIEPGDLLGFRITASGAGYQYYAIADADTNFYYCADTAGDTAYNWEGQVSIGHYIVPIECYMNPPYIVGIGDSIMAGHTAHYSYCETTRTNDPTSHLMFRFYDMSGWNYQNMGIGSQKIADIKARFATDVIALSPEYCILQGGGNDYGGTPPTDKSAWLSDYEDILTACTAAGIQPIALLMTPWTGGSTAQMRARDSWNKLLKALAYEYDALVIDPNPAVGEFRVGGDPNNLWDIQAIYSGDGVHFWYPGHLAIATLIYNALYPLCLYPDIPDWPTIHDDIPVGQELYDIITAYITDLSALIPAYISSGNLMLDADKGIYFDNILQISVDAQGFVFNNLEIQSSLMIDNMAVDTLTVDDINMAEGSLTITNSLAINQVAFSQTIMEIISRTYHKFTKIAEPAAPAEDQSVIWLSDGTGYGNDNDLCCKITEGAVTKSFILSAWTQPNFLHQAKGLGLYTISGTEYALVAGYGDNALILFDVSDPTAMSLTGILHGSGPPNYLMGAQIVECYTIGGTEYAFIGSKIDHQLVIVNISMPSNPVLTSHFDTNGYDGIALATVGGTEYLYLAGVFWITIHDVSIPASPVYSAFRQWPTKKTMVLYNIGGTEYIINVGTQAGDTAAFIYIYDISASPVLTWAGFLELTGYSFANIVNCITISGTEYALVGCQKDLDGYYYILIIDISIPAAPVIVAERFNGDYPPYSVGVATILNSSYMFFGELATIEAVDITTPAAPVHTAWLQSDACLEGLYDIDYAVLSDIETLIVTASESNALNAIRVGYYSIDCDATYYAEAANNTILDITTEDLCISAWIRADTGVTTPQRIFMKYQADTATGYALSLINGKIRLYICGANAYYMDGNTDLRDDTWHHIAAVIDRDNAANCKIYLDGAEDGTTNKTGTVTAVGSITNTAILVLGAYSGTYINKFEGQISDIKAYFAIGNVWSEAEILYQSQHKRDYTASAGTLTDYWHIQDKTGITLTGNVNNLTLTDAAAWAFQIDMEILDTLQDL